MRENWGDHQNISSFYFTRFLEDTTEEELWQHFKKAGDVREIFISRKRNRNGRRYGFARFKGGEDVNQLEKRLDNIVVGGLKLYVNIPKYGRATPGGTQPETRIPTFARQHEQEGRGTYQAKKSAAVPGLKRGSFADVVARRNPRMDQMIPSTGVSYISHSSRSEVHLDIPLSGRKWLQDAWVGRLKNLTMFDRLEEDMLWDFGINIVPKYIGDDMVLLLGLT